MRKTLDRFYGEKALIQLHLDLNLYAILQMLNVTPFWKMPILEVISIIQP